jgi:hypothetical protein
LRTRGPSRSREDVVGLVDRRTRRGARARGGEQAGVVGLDLLGGHELAILVTTQDGRFGEGGEGEGFEFV